MNILIATNHEYIKYTTVMLYSLFVNNDTDIAVYLPYTCLTDEDIQLLKDFIQLFPNKTFHPFMISKDFDEKVTSHNGISIETYYRILAIDCLPMDIDKILYLDVDMVIQGSIQELYNVDITGYPFGVCEDILGILNSFHEANKYRMGIPKEYSYFNAGVMLFNLKYLRENNSAENIINCIYNNQEKYEYNDQDVLNEMYYDKLVWLPWDKYNCPPGIYMLDQEELKNKHVRFATYEELKAIKDNPEIFTTKYLDLSEQMKANATIIHYMGASKPWKADRNSSTYLSFNEAYYKYELPASNRVGVNGGLFTADRTSIVKDMLSDNYTYFYLLNRVKKAKSPSVKTIVAGSSYGVQGILDNSLDSLANLSGPSQDIRSSVMLVKQVINNRMDKAIELPSTCVLILGYYCLYDDLLKSPRDIAKSYYITYEPIANKDSKYDYRKEIRYKYAYLTDSQIEECAEYINMFFDGNDYFNSIYSREENDREYIGNWSLLNIQEKKHIANERTTKHNHLKNHNEISEENKRLLGDFISFISNCGIKPVIVIPPFSDDYLEVINIDFKSEIIEFLDSLEQEVELLDINEYSLFFESDFFDSDHLNDNGARKFTEVICNLRI